MAIGSVEAVGDSCLRTIRRLESIGIRLAGSRQEQAAAAWIQEQMEAIGLDGVRQQEFPCLGFESHRCRVELPASGQWSRVESEPATNSPSTNGVIELPLTVLEQIPRSEAKRKAQLGGRAILLYASLLDQVSSLKQVMAAQPAALLMVDDRFHGDWTVGISFPRDRVGLLKCPVVNISYRDAWEMVKGGVSTVRIDVDTSIREAVSQNVIGELTGDGNAGEIIVVSAHHDTVGTNPGLDDNATGVAALLELARTFASTRPRRTLRFIAFGTEEQLSEGARYYAQHAPDLDRIQLALNIDSIGAWMGQTGIYCSGPPELRRVVEDTAEEADFPAHIVNELSPFGDHFPLNACGVPALWYYRKTFVAGRHFHHSRLETIDVVSPAVLEQTIAHQASLLRLLANAVPLPFPRALGTEQEATLSAMAREWLGTERLR